MPPKKRARKEQKVKSVWVVTMTRFTDDYKPRGGDWSQSEPPVLFLKRKNAERCLLEKLVEYMEEGNMSHQTMDKYFERDAMSITAP